MNAAEAIRPRRTCDVVMKGGITSGVVYPRAIAVLAKRFDFKNIGGTSAGAIAAAIAAAAQYRRNSGQGEGGFEMLGRLPDILSEKVGSEGHTRLFHLFQPNTKTRRIFGVLTSAMGGSGSTILRAVISQYGMWACVGALPGLLLAIWSGMYLGGAAIVWVWFLVSIFLFLAGAVVGGVVGFARDSIRELPANRYGLCRGIPDAPVPGAPPDRAPADALTVWLTKYLNETAGLPADGAPLTFGKLWGTTESDPDLHARAVNLEMMTTNLTHGRPYRLPFRYDEDLKENQTFYFRKEEFESLFPAQVVQWMIDHPRLILSEGARKIRDENQRQKLLAAGYYPLPAPADFPVVVVTRMSLSFPVLLSTVPLHCIDYTRMKRQEGEDSGELEEPMPERCSFSDGGMSSNFPLHFFDTALPRRPTFSFDLTEKPRGTPASALVPEMDGHNMAAPVDRWNRFDTEIPTTVSEIPKDKPNLQRLTGFVGSMLNAMQNWTDATQGRLPGYRDRIVRVPLTPDEGGLNLDMAPELIAALTKRGTEAAEVLMQHFDVPAVHPKMTWDNHRWIRFRSFLAALEKTVTQLVGAINEPENQDRSYQDWLVELKAAKGDAGLQAPSYEMSDERIEAAIQTLELLRKIEALWKVFPVDKHIPRPRPILRPRAQV
jgi:predicted acylesterase/phospholipase RssA